MATKKNKKTTKKLNNNKYMALAIGMIALAIIIVVVYFLFINKNTKLILDKSERIDPEFAWANESLSGGEVEGHNDYESQAEIWNNLMDRYKKEKPTIDNPIVVVNPFEVSPLTGIVLFKTKKEEKVTVTIKGKHNDDLTRTFESSKDHYIPLYGLYGYHNNTVEIKTESGASKTLDIYIDKTNNDAFDNEGNLLNVVEENKLGGSNGEFYFGTSSMGASTIAYDNYGEIRWYFKTVGYSKGMTMLQNGNMLLSSYTTGPDVTSTGGVVEVDIFGRVIHEYNIEGGYHHDGYELPNGNLIILTSDMSTDSVADYIIELDRESGKVVKDWSLRKIVADIDPTISTTYPTWGWINSVYFDEAGNNLILSLRNMNSVVSLSYNDSKINWILGEEKYWGAKFKDLLLKGTGTDFSYTHGQHSVIYKDGVLSLFDNGYDAYREDSVSCASIKDNVSYAKKYKIDENNKTAELLWKYGGNEYFSYALSSFNYTSNGNMLFNSGWHFTKDVPYSDPECTQFTNYLYDTYLLELDKDGNTLVKLHLPESKFEVVKADIYNLANNSVRPSNKDVIPNYSFTYAIVTDTNPLGFVEMNKEEAFEYKANEGMIMPVYTNNGYITLSTALNDTHELYLVFISPNGKSFKYNVRKVGDIADKSPYYLSLPKGKYHVYFTDNGEIYDTLQYVVVKK